MASYMAKLAMAQLRWPWPLAIYIYTKSTV